MKPEKNRKRRTGSWSDEGPVDLDRGIAAVEACRTGDILPLAKILDPRLKNFLFVLFLCSILRDERTPPKHEPDYLKVGFAVDAERRRRPGVKLDAICHDLAEQARFPGLAWRSIRRYYQRFQSRTKPYATLLDMMRRTPRYP